MQPVQLRLGFGQPTNPVTLRLDLTGLAVLVDVAGGTEADGWAYLSAAGIDATITDLAGLTFTVKDLPKIAALPPQVQTLAATTIKTLWTLVTNPPADGSPATLDADALGTLWLRWSDGDRTHDEELPSSAAAALATAELPFVATSAGFDALRRHCQVPLLVGRASLNLDGIVEIVTSKPQLVESSPLPGLFRIDETHYGLALPHVSVLQDAPGFKWEGPALRLDRGPTQLPPNPMPLSKHATADLRRIVDNLAAFRAQAIAWDSGLGRRVFALAAVEALDAWPALIVCHASAVWAWQRHVEMIGRRASLSHLDSDVLILPYDQLGSRVRELSPQTVIFDEPTSAPAAEHAAACAGALGSLLDCYRIAVTSQLPADPAELVAMMALLRPGEFRPDLPIVDRYPPDAAARAREHAGCYVASRRASDPGRDDTNFRRSQVLTLDMSQAQATAVSDIFSRREPRAVVLSEALELYSAGTRFATSPKIAAAVEIASDAVDDARRVVLLTRHLRTEKLLTQSLRAYTPAVLTAAAALERGVPHQRCVVLRFDRELPDLSWFDDVVVVDYPWSTAALDYAVGSAADPDGPLRVCVLHLNGPLDDKLALLAARRREKGSVVDQTVPPSEAEIDYLLGGEEPR